MTGARTITFLDEVRTTLLPGRGAKYGLLPPQLVGMTVVAGLVDAFSYLTLGHVFVANMTGNVVFLGFALAGIGGFSAGASLVALGAFLVGSLSGGMIGSRLDQRPSRLLSVGAAGQAVFLAGAVVLGALAGNFSGGYRYALLAILGIGMGIQNATARKLAVPDLTTTVLTMTITGIAADTRMAGGSGSKAGRRLIAIAALLIGASIGATLVLHDLVLVPLILALVIAAFIALTSWAASLSPKPV